MCENGFKTEKNIFKYFISPISQNGSNSAENQLILLSHQPELLASPPRQSSARTFKNYPTPLCALPQPMPASEHSSFLSSTLRTNLKCAPLPLMRPLRQNLVSGAWYKNLENREALSAKQPCWQCISADQPLLKVRSSISDHADLIQLQRRASKGNAAPAAGWQDLAGSNLPK